MCIYVLTYFFMRMYLYMLFSDTISCSMIKKRKRTWYILSVKSFHRILEKS